ncbi:MAG: chemotaxis protein CheC [Hungatella sp.]
MHINTYDDLDALQRDAMKEIGSIGTGNAATALSALLSKPVQMTVPHVNILGYDDAVKEVGNPEEIIAGILVRMTGEINGVMLYIQKLDFINMVLDQLFSRTIEDFSMLSEIENSALEEIGNIMISSYVNALSSFTDMNINLSVPGISVNMLGAIITVPMAELGYQTDKVMIIDGKFICGGTKLSSHLLMMPDMASLNHLLEKLGIHNG